MRRMCVAVATVLLAAGSARAADDFYLTVFTAETVPFRSKYTHTFVAFQRVPCGGGPVEQHHISWLPANLNGRRITLHPEPGVNLPVADTFAYCRKHEMRMSAWGPYRIKPELFEMLKCQAAKLSAGTVMYKPTDNLYNSDYAANCYHAIWQPVAPHRKYSGAFNCGDASGAATVQLFRCWIIDPCQTHDAVLDLVVPKGETVLRRSFDDRPGRIDAIKSAVGR